MQARASKMRKPVSSTARKAAGAVLALAVGTSGLAQARGVKATMPTAAAAPATKPARSSHQKEKPVKQDPAAAARLKEQGDSLQKAGKLDAAATVYAKGYAMDPSNVSLVEEYGRTLYSLTRYKDAAELFKKAATPSEPAAFWNLGYALRKLHDYQGAADAYRAYVQANPTDPDGLYSLAECYRQLGRTDDAVAQYNLYLQKENRADQQAWVDKAKKKVDTLKDQQASAARAQTTIASSAPGLGGPMVIALPVAAPAPAPAFVAPAPVVPAAPIAVAPAPIVVVAAPPFVAPAPVVAVAAPAVVMPAPIATVAPVPVAAPAPVIQPVASAASRTRDPAAALARVKEGDRYLQQKQFSDAMSSYQDAISLDDQCTSAFLRMGLTYANQGRFQDAIGQWEHVQQIDPNDKYAPGYIAKAKARLATAAAAASAPPAAPVIVAAAPATARTVSPEDDAASKDAYRRALQLMKEQKYQDSLGELATAIDKNPGYVNAYVARGGAYFGLRNFSAAVADYQKSLAINGNIATPLFGLAKAFDKQGDKAQSCDAFRKYLASTAPDVQPKLKAQAQQAIAACGP
jgi:tetratricopeptide (TPR) repeat protein